MCLAPLQLQTMSPEELQKSKLPLEPSILNVVLSFFK